MWIVSKNLLFQNHLKISKIVEQNLKKKIEIECIYKYSQKVLD